MALGWSCPCRTLEPNQLMTFINKSICRAQPPQRAPQNPHCHLSLAGKTMEFNTGNTGKRCDSTKFPVSKSHGNIHGWILGRAGQVEPCSCRPPSGPSTVTSYKPGNKCQTQGNSRKKYRKQQKQRNKLYIPKESSQAAKVEVDAVRSLELPCATRFLG